VPSRAGGTASLALRVVGYEAIYRFNIAKLREEGVVQSHQSDARLLPLDNPYYTFNKGAVRSVLSEGTAVPDLSSLPFDAGEMTGRGWRG
jgi:hypothetical protein